MAKKVAVLDHHKTAEEALTNWTDKPDNLDLVFDMNRAGAGITWDYFYPNDLRPMIIDYIEDRDLWKFNYKHSKKINAYISTVPNTFEDYDDLSRDALEEMETTGRGILAYHQQICEQIILDARSIVINTKEGLACNCTPQFSSEVGSLLALKLKTYGATYHTLADGSTKFSLRSVGEYDVSTIAKLFGGGGHKNAAGFTVYSPSFSSDARITLWQVDSTCLEPKLL